MVEVVLKRVFEKGRLCFQLPADEGMRDAIRRELTKCQKKNNDYVLLTMRPPKRPRTTGKESQNHHLNGHIMQICNYTGHDYEEIKYMVKMIAVEQLGYPSKLVRGHVFAQPEHLASVEECALLIEAAHMLAAELGITLREC